MINHIFATLDTLLDFAENTDSLAKAMTVAVTIREIAKVIISYSFFSCNQMVYIFTLLFQNLKVVSTHHGRKLINLPGSTSSKIAVSQSITGQAVHSHIKLYNNITSTGNLNVTKRTRAERPKKKGRHRRSISVPPEEKDIVTDEETKNEDKESSREDTLSIPGISKIPRTPRTPRSDISEEQMEAAITFRMETISKKKGKFFSEMMNSPTLGSIFEEDLENEKKEKLGRLLDVSFQ